MKNPRLFVSPAALTTQAFVPTEGLTLMESKDGAFVDVLKTFKFSPAEIGRITSLVGTIGKIAATANWVVGAIVTVKSLLTAIGLFDKEEDASRKLMESIAARVEQIYKHLLNDSRRQLYVQKTGWRTTLTAARKSISNAGRSRSQENINTLIDDCRNLQRAIEEMLAPEMAEITFDRASQGYVATYPRSHWLDVASPFYLQTSAGPLPADYSAATSDLGETIWDPGYYLDILFEAIGLRIAGLTVLEPAFRSTAQDRDDLVTIHRALLVFLQRWSKAMFKTRVIGPIDPVSWPHPTVGPLGLQGPHVEGHHLSHPFQWPTETIALGVIDPATGLAALDFQHSEKFKLAQVRDFPGNQPYWVLTNFKEATDAAYARIDQLQTKMRALCGLDRAYALYHHVGDLVNGPPGGSEFADISDVAFGSGDLHPTGAPEQVSLGLIGAFAGKGGKQYKADRFHWFTVKKFRIPMARRMDVSGIQLGYRMEVDLGGPDGLLDIVLCPYSSQASTTQENELPLFPTGTITSSLATSKTTVYDVLQSATFSSVEEEEFERTGSTTKRRLFLNPREGRAEVSVWVSFTFDVSAPEHAFVGYADVEIAAPDRWPNSHGFMCDVRVYEERWLYLQPTGQPARDFQQEVVADQLRLHFAPSFLVVEPDYFTDRDAGMGAMNKMFDEVSKRFAISKFLGPLDPIERVARVSLEEKAAVQTYELIAREAPRFAEETLRRYAPPMVVHEVQAQV